jgi:hypothetical protein
MARLGSEPDMKRTISGLPRVAAISLACVGFMGGVSYAGPDPHASTPDALAELNRLSLSGYVYFQALAELGLLPAPEKPQPKIELVSTTSALTIFRNETNDQKQDVEPTTISVGSRTTTAFIKYSDCTLPNCLLQLHHRPVLIRGRPPAITDQSNSL